MPRCLGTKRDSSPCTVIVDLPKTYCWWHDPANSAARREAASRGGRRAGRGRPSVELARLGHRFEELADKVLEGELERGVAAVAGQLLSGSRACIRDTLIARDQEELIARMEALEEALIERKQGSSRYGV
jgi:hypothetical protein